MIKFPIFFLFLLTFLATACVDSGVTPAPDTGTETKTSSAQANESDNPNTQERKSESPACQNDYYPIDTTEDLRYQVTGDIPGGYVLSRNEIDDKTFVEKRVFDSGLEVSVNWICSEAGLRTAEFKNTAALPNANFKMETLESSGVTLPKQWNVGKTWDANYRVKANISGPASASAKGTVIITNRIVSMDDEIEIAGNKVQAARVDSTIKMNLKMNGRTIPSKPVKMTNWYTKDIGLVKNSSSAQFGKSGIEFLRKE